MAQCKLLALCAAVVLRPAYAFQQECWSMGETCGDESKCTGMGTHCGDRSECSGSSTTCGAASICSGMDSHCGPGSQCTGLVAQCDSIAQPGQSQSQSSGMSPMKPMEPMHMEPMKPMKPMEPMHMEPMQQQQPMTVYTHGCEIGDVCSSRPGASQSNGVTICCDSSCGDCSASTSQSGSVLTATCVCRAQKAAQMKPLQPMKPMPKVHAPSCETGNVCDARPGAASAGGVKLCCPANCGQCSVFGTDSGGIVNAMCACSGESSLAATPAAEGSAVHAVVALAAVMGVTLLLAARSFKIADDPLKQPGEGRMPLLA